MEVAFVKKVKKVESAWESFFESFKVHDRENLRAEGWKTLDEMTKLMNRARNTVDWTIRRSGKFDFKTVTCRTDSGSIRKILVARLKDQG
jgi:hypothetical protein